MRTSSVSGSVPSARAATGWRGVAVRVAGCFLIGGLAAAAASATLRDELNSATALARRFSGQIGVMVAAVEGGEEVYTYNADRLFIPASNVKLFTTAAALDAFGPGFQYVTPLLARGELSGGTLQGDLAVVGSGDPNLSGRLYAGDPVAVFRRWGAVLREAGIHSVTGDLILVDGLFDDRYVHPSWPHDQLDRWYEAPVASLALADGCVLVRVRPGPRPGAPLEVEVLPHGSGIQLANRGRTVGSRDRAALGIARPPGSSVIVVSGSMQVDASPFDRWVSVRDPVAYFGAVLRETLEREGVTIRGGIREEERLSAGAWLRVAAHRTDLLTTVEVTNKRSQNFYAEALLKLLGARLCDDGSFEGGVEALRRFAQRIGVPDGWRLVDGSGMSRDNRLAPRHLVALLLAMTKHRYGGELLRSLPWGGEPDAGRWERRLASPPYRGNVFAKTGTLGGVSALSGYAKARSGRLYVFSILSNEVRSGSAADDAEDRIVRAIVDHG